MNNIVIGTAGHVDHGKTTLVKALTGIDTDRLPEEKKRGITIDIGFGNITLPSGKNASLVDVPGHERFIKNMVAGATGIDLVIIVVAADEGIMPQTLEHLDILNLLGMKTGVIAITKSDLVDEEWIEMLNEDIDNAFKGTFLESAPRVISSAVSGYGIAELKKVLDSQIENAAPSGRGYFSRLPVDRIFTKIGFGTIATGTLLGGAFSVDDQVEILPAGIQSRIRGLHIHGRLVPTAEPGNRVAINLSNVQRHDIARGNVICKPGTMKPETSFACTIQLLKSAPLPLKNLSTVHFHTGTDEALARVILLEKDIIRPGETTYARLKVDSPVVAWQGDKYIIRSYSPTTTIGGGTILDPGGCPRRYNAKDMEYLRLKNNGDLLDAIMSSFYKIREKPVEFADLQKITGISESDLRDLLSALEKAGKIIKLDTYYAESNVYNRLSSNILQYLENYHKSHPFEQGTPKDEVRQNAAKGWDSRAFNALALHMESKGKISLARDKISLGNHKICLTSSQLEIKQHILNEYLQNPFAPPSPAEVIESTKSRYNASQQEVSGIFRMLVDDGDLVRLPADLVIHSTALDKAKELLLNHLAEHGKIKAAEFRDLAGTSRKYAIPLLEYFDRQKITLRIGDERTAFRA